MSTPRGELLPQSDMVMSFDFSQFPCGRVRADLDHRDDCRMPWSLFDLDALMIDASIMSALHEAALTSDAGLLWSRDGMSRCSLSSITMQPIDRWSESLMNAAGERAPVFASRVIKTR